MCNLADFLFHTFPLPKISRRMQLFISHRFHRVPQSLWGRFRWISQNSTELLLFKIALSPFQAFWDLLAILALVALLPNLPIK